MKMSLSKQPKVSSNLTLKAYDHSINKYWTQFMPQWFLRFSEFTEFNESFASFKENSSNTLQDGTGWYHNIDVI